MVKEEITGIRDLTYSKWHRTLPSYCYMIDLDSIEWRSDRGVVALIEHARFTAVVYRKKFQLKVIKELAQKIGVPAYLVLYHDAMNYFEVYDLLSAEEWGNCHKQIMDESAYRTFIQKL